MLSPPVTRQSILDFDLDSLDPLKSDTLDNLYAPQPASGTTAAVSAAGYIANISHSNSWNSFVNIPASDENAFQQNSVTRAANVRPDFTDMPSSKTLPYNLNPFVNSSTAYSKMQNPFAPAVPAHRDLYAPTSNVVSLSDAKANPFGAPANEFGFTPGSFPKEKVHKLSLSPTFGPVHSQRMARIPSDSNIIVSTAKEQAKQSMTTQRTEFKRVPSSDAIAGNAVTPNSKAMKPHELQLDLTEDNDDLMTFNNSAVNVDNCLSLESFDPLSYVSTVHGPGSHLFTNLPETTSSYTSLTTQDILEKVRAMGQPVKHYHTIDTQQLSQHLLNNDARIPLVPSETNLADSDQQKKSHSRNESTGNELLDPFNISDLTKSMEKKRQKHAKEQEARKAAQLKEPAELAQSKQADIIRKGRTPGASRSLDGKSTLKRQGAVIHRPMLPHDQARHMVNHAKKL